MGIRQTSDLKYLDWSIKHRLIQACWWKCFNSLIHLRFFCWAISIALKPYKFLFILTIVHFSYFHCYELQLVHFRMQWCIKVHVNQKLFLMFLSAVWTLILTAPIHCRGSIGEKLMQCYISPNLFWYRNRLMYLCSKSFKYDLYKLSHLHIRTPTLAVHWKLHCDKSLAWSYFPHNQRQRNAEKLSNPTFPW